MSTVAALHQRPHRRHRSGHRAREAKDWCVAHYPGSPIKEIGPIYKPPQGGATSGEEGGFKAAHQFA